MTTLLNRGRVTQRHAVGTCPKCGAGVATRQPGRTTCPRCAAALVVEVVRGAFSDGIVCDPRCQFARGPICDCQCGGENHGGGYLDAGTVPPDIILRDQQAHTAKLAARAERARAERDAEAARIRKAQAAWLTPERLQVLESLRADQAAGSEFADSLLGHYDRTGELTERQEAAVRRGMARRAERAAADAARPQPTAAPFGRDVRVAGEVLSTRVQEGYHRATYKMLLLDDRGFRVWVTAPSSLWGGRGPVVHLDDLRGRRVQMLVELKRKPDSTDDAFALGLRPRNAVLL